MDAARTADTTSRRQDAWASVRRHNYLSAEAKLAWWLLWRTAGNRPGTIAIHPAAVGEDQGAGDATRSGRRSIDALASHGLVRVLDKDRCSWKVYLDDPVAIERARLVGSAANEGQGLLFEEEAPESPSPETVAVPLRPQVDPSPPAALRPPPPAAAAAPSPGNFFSPEQAVVAQPPPAPRSSSEVKGLEEEEDSRSRSSRPRTLTSDLGDGGRCATTADRENADRENFLRWAAAEKRRAGQSAPDEPRSLGASLPANEFGAILSRLHRQRDEQPAEATRLAEEIFRQVADPCLARGICDAVAWAIVDGLYPRSKLQTILRKLLTEFRARAAGDRGRYFIAAIRQSFRDCRLPDPTRKKAGRETP